MPLRTVCCRSHGQSNQAGVKTVENSAVVQDNCLNLTPACKVMALVSQSSQAKEVLGAGNLDVFVTPEVNVGSEETLRSFVGVCSNESWQTTVCCELQKIEQGRMRSGLAVAGDSAMVISRGRLTLVQGPAYGQRDCKPCNDRDESWLGAHQNQMLLERAPHDSSGSLLMAGLDRMRRRS